jgi:hypothetical protein
MGFRIGLILAALCAITPARATSDVATPWHGGEYRDFAPAADPSRAPSGVVTRAVGPGLKIERVTVQLPKVRQGDFAALIAQYDVVAPSGTIEVKETRVISFNGAVLTQLARVVSRNNGPVGSEYRLKIPAEAADGWYTVTTIIEPVKAAPVTRSGGTGKASAAFYVETAQEKPAASAAGAKDSPTLKLWTDKSSYRVGDAITVHFQTSQDGYLTLVNVGSSGKITILFPNRFSGGQEVKAGKVYRIPAPEDSYELALAGPPGTELIYALRTAKPMKFSESDFSRTSEIFRSVTDGAGTFTRDINVVVKRTPREEQAKALLEVQVAP